MKSWLKYGLYGIIIGLLIFLISIPLNALGINFDCTKNLEGVCSTGILSIFRMFATALFKWPFRFFKSSIVLELIIWILQLFVVGAIFGWIIGLFRRKKK